MDENASIIVSGAMIAASNTACTLIEKISEATGGLFAPYLIRRKALAEADAARSMAAAEREIKTEGAINMAETEEKINYIRYRASIRHAGEEVKKQANMESILAQAIPEINDGARCETLDDDWIVNFFDKCRTTSSKEMQALWAKVLAGEANSPGHYSKRTVNVLQSLEVRDAELFSALCRFIWTVGGRTIPLIFETKPKGTIYAEHGINFEKLNSLADIGLINLNILAGYSIIPWKEFLDTDYMGREYQIGLLLLDKQEVRVGNAMLTQIGKELASVVQVGPVEGLWEYVIEQWQQGRAATGVPETVKSA